MTSSLNHLAEHLQERQAAYRLLDLAVARVRRANAQITEQLLTDLREVYIRWTPRRGEPVVLLVISKDLVALTGTVLGVSEKGLRTGCEWADDQLYNDVWDAYWDLEALRGNQAKRRLLLISGACTSANAVVVPLPCYNDHLRHQFNLPAVHPSEE